MVISVKNYTKKLKGVTVLDDISIEFKSGKCYGLKGKNGSGKTMLMRAICGLIYPTSGYVSVDGKKIGKDISFPPSIGVLIENPAFISNYTGYKNLELLASIKGRIKAEDIRNAMESVGLEPDDKRKYRKYSLGMKQKLGIASAFMEKPDIIILDEPINAIDEEGVKKVKKLISDAKNAGAVIIVACHDAEELNSLADEIINISEGRLTGEDINA